MKQVNRHKKGSQKKLAMKKLPQEPTTLSTPHPEGKHKHQRVKKYLFKKPAPLNTWGVEEHRSESWMELFIGEVCCNIFVYCINSYLPY
jgi:hypothetical protein